MTWIMLSMSYITHFPKASLLYHPLYQGLFIISPTLPRPLYYITHFTKASLLYHPLYQGLFIISPTLSRPLYYITHFIKASLLYHPLHQGLFIHSSHNRKIIISSLFYSKIKLAVQISGNFIKSHNICVCSLLTVHTHIPYLTMMNSFPSMHICFFLIEYFY